jgi:asparagine synthase (glutamine-hydrolysing)
MNFVGRWTSSTQVADIEDFTPSATTRRIDTPSGALFLFGQCLAADTEISTSCAEVARTGGTSAPGPWPGSFSSALVTRSGITLLTDPTGQFPLFVTEKAGTVRFGTRSSVLAAVTGAALDRISLTIAVVIPDITELLHGRSMREGVRRIPDGRFLTIGPAGVTEREYDVVKASEDVGLTESAQRLRLSLTNGVRVRTTLVGDITFDLSGGIDSTSLAVLASGDLDRLDVFTHVNPRAPVVDDAAHARRHVRLTEGMHQHVVQTDSEHLPYQVLGPAQEFPHGSLVATGALRARLQRAAELGSTIHVVGEGGDVVLGAPAVYLADLARRGDLTRLWRHCLSWGRLRARSPVALFRRAVLTGRTTRQQALRALAATIEAGGARPAECWERDKITHLSHPLAHWLTPAARRSLATHVRAVADRAVDTSAPGGIADAVTMDRLRQQALTLNTVRAVGAEFGIEVHAPFMDTEVVRACLSLPAHRRADPSTPKPLLRAALSGLVPDAVLTRTTKGDYTRDAHLGVRRAADALRRTMTDPAAADLGILEPAPVRAVLDGAIQGLPTPWGALNQVFAVETWLREKGNRP